MKSKFYHDGIRAPRRSAFSLVELLTVVGIMAALFLIASPVVNSLLDSNNISRGGQMLADQVNLGRQTASSRNRAVELRLIKVPDRAKAGFSALQLWMTDATGTPKEMERAILLPQAVVIAQSESLSEGLKALPTKKMPSTSAIGANQDYEAFQIRPNGMITPSQEIQEFYFTIVPVRFADQGEFPPNYAMVQVNPLTATPLVYRP